MKQIFVSGILALFIITAYTQQPKGTVVGKRHVLTEGLYSDSTAILFENHFIRNRNKVTYQPFDIKMPFKDLYFDVYGNSLKISAYKVPELIEKGGVIFTGSYRDTAKKDAGLF